MAGSLLTGTGNVANGVSASGTTLVINKPTNAVEGDVLLAFIYHRLGTAQYTTTPTDWTVVSAPADSTAGLLSVWKYTVPASAPSSWTWAGGASGRHLGLAFRTSNIASTTLDVAGTYATLIDSGVAITATTGPRVRLSAITTSYADDLYIGIAASNTTGGAPGGFNAPSGMTVAGTVSTATGGSDSNLTIVQQTVATASSIAIKDMFSSVPAASGAGFPVALRTTATASPGGGGTTVNLPVMGTLPVVAPSAYPRDMYQLEQAVAGVTAQAAFLKAYVDGATSG